MKFHKITTEINNAFFRLESFANGAVNEYKSFDFNNAFTDLFIETRKPENFTYSNCKLIGKYWDLTERIRVDYDKSEFINFEAYSNESFCKDCEEIMYLNWERIEEFASFSTPDNIKEFERKFSITDIINSQSIQHSQNKKSKSKLTIKLIALKHVYLGSHITRKNADRIIKEYGHNSGEKLFQEFIFYSSPANRKGRPNPCTPTRFKNKINRLEKVIELLPKDKQEKAKKELSILKDEYESEYG